MDESKNQEIKIPTEFKIINWIVFGSSFFFTFLMFFALITLGLNLESEYLSGYREGMFESLKIENVSSAYNYGKISGTFIIRILFLLIPLIGLHLRKMFLLRIGLIIALFFSNSIIFLLLIFSFCLTFRNNLKEYFILFNANEKNTAN